MPDPKEQHLPPFRAHAIISNPITYGHIHVAEKLGVPLHIMFPQPWVPTEAFAHPLSNMPYNGKSSEDNFKSYQLVDLGMWQLTEGMVNQFRLEVLLLHKIQKSSMSMLLDQKIPHSFMWSKHVVPRPDDWDMEIFDVVGTVLDEAPHEAYEPPSDLTAFLAAGEAPLFVGFGSMILPDPPATTRMILEAATKLNCRIVIQSCWSDMILDDNDNTAVIPANVYFLGDCPHDWLFPRMAAVVHHGGSGTTAAGLLAGKPTFIVPYFGDQPFWGWAVAKAKVRA